MTIEEKATILIEGEVDTKRIVAHLVGRSAWFELMPHPDDVWSLVVKEESRDFVNRLIGESTEAVLSQIPDPPCPKCGQQMGRQTVPNDGTWWCGSIKCGFSFGPPDDAPAMPSAAPSPNQVSPMDGLEAPLRPPRPNRPQPFA